MNNITKIQFNPDQDYIWGIQGLEQWDQGQKLEISGLDISDEIVEVHFSLDEVQGNAKRMLGVVKGGVIHADIPVFILEGPEHIFCNADTYSAYAWIYVSDDESAETIRKMEFTIKARPKPDEYVTPEELTFLQQLELAIQNKLDKSGHAPNKFLGTDEKGNVVTKEQEEFSLKVANEEKLGGVKPLNKTDDMTLEVGVDKDGRLFAKGKDITVDSKLDEESQNPVQNKVLTKEVKTLKEHNTQLKETIEKLQIKQTTDKAPFHHITDSANMKVLDFGMEGKTTQDGTPTPENQVEIVNAGVYNEETGRYEHKFGFVNENLLPNNPEKWDIGKMLYWSASKGTEVGWATRVYSAYTEIEIQPNTNICFHNDMTNKYWVSRIVETDSNRFGYSNHDLYTSIAKNYADYSFKTLSNTVKLLVEVRLVDDTQTFTEADLQEMKIIFGYGDSVSYTPHASQPFTLTSDRPITMWDKMIKRDGVWGWSIWSSMLNIDGSTFKSWTAGQDNQLRVFSQYGVSGLSLRNEAFCEKFRFVANPQNLSPQEEAIDWNGTTLQFYLNESRGITDVSTFNTYLNENPISIRYQSTSEVAFHPLPDEEQTLLNNLETYYGVTNVYNDQGCPMWLTYVNDTKLYVDQKLLEIQQAMI